MTERNNGRATREEKKQRKCKQHPMKDEQTDGQTEERKKNT